jgi:DNA polymerase-3 subunit delta
VPAWKPAFLIHGDDHGRLAERRAALRALAERESGANGTEVLEGDAATPQATAAALSTMTFAIGRRFVVVDGVQDWKDADCKEHVVPALKALDPDTTVVFFAREDGRRKAPPSLAKAVTAAGGLVDAEQQLKAKELPQWCIAQATKLGLQLDTTAARALVARVGERQQRLLRELEKLALEHGEGARIGVEEVEEEAAASAERQIWGFVDALAARQGPQALRAYLDLREQGESLPRLVPLVARRVRELLGICLRLEAGETPQAVKASLKGSPWMLDRRIKEARATDSYALRTALEALAQLELEARGLSDLDQETDAILALRRIAAAA